MGAWNHGSAHGDTGGYVRAPRIKSHSVLSAGPGIHGSLHTPGDLPVRGAISRHRTGHPGAVLRVPRTRVGPGPADLGGDQEPVRGEPGCNPFGVPARRNTVR